jgi:hypothetical protein
MRYGKLEDGALRFEAAKTKLGSATSEPIAIAAE